MNWVDATVVAVVALSALLAFMRGFVRELFSIGAWLGAGYFAIYTVGFVRDRITAFVGGPEIGTPLSYAAMFLPALIVLSMITGALAKLVHRSGLGGLDRTLGLGFGVVRAGLLLAAAYIVLGWLIPTENWPEPLRQARSVPYAHEVAVWAVRYLPDQYRPNIVPPPGQRETNSADLLHATPQGRAIARP